MIHLRIVIPADLAEPVCQILESTASVCNVVHFAGAARRPPGDVVLCDVPSEDASLVLADLREAGVDHRGTIVVDEIDSYLSDALDVAERIAPGAPSDAVIWEQVEGRTHESSTLSATFLAFMVIAGLIACVGIFLDSAILIVGAMVVGPEFGPIAAFCVAMVQRRGPLAWRSLTALLVGFPAAIVAVLLTSLAFQATGVTPDDFSEADHDLANVIANPDFLAFFVAFFAGVAGMLSLSTAKSAALIGVFISITTIPAAANIGVAVAYGEWDTARGSGEQLAVNLVAILFAGVLTLAVQRHLYARRRSRHLDRLA